MVSVDLTFQYVNKLDIYQLYLKKMTSLIAINLIGISPDIVGYVGRWLIGIFSYIFHITKWKEKARGEKVWHFLIHLF